MLDKFTVCSKSIANFLVATKNYRGSSRSKAGYHAQKKRLLKCRFLQIEDLSQLIVPSTDFLALLLTIAPSSAACVLVVNQLLSHTFRAIWSPGHNNLMATGISHHLMLFLPSRNYLFGKLCLPPTPGQRLIPPPPSWTTSPPMTCRGRAASPTPSPKLDWSTTNGMQASSSPHGVAA